MMVVDNKFEIGQIVYLKTDPEQLPRIITGIMIAPTAALVYWTSMGMVEGRHYDIEISATKDVNYACTNQITEQ